MGDFQDGTSEKLERMRREIVGQHPTRNRNAPVDPYDLAQVKADVLQGRDRDHYDRWRRVMEHHRFVFLTPEQLNAHPLIGPMRVPTGLSVQGVSDLSLGGRGIVYDEKPHTEPQWRRFGRFAEAFTPADLISMFNDSPEEFDGWIRDRTMKRYAKQQGIVIPEAILRPARAAAMARRRSRGKLIIPGRG